MLILPRKPGESLVLFMPDGRRISVSVERFKGERVHIGIEAPEDVVVHRGEAIAALCAANTGGAKGSEGVNLDQLIDGIDTVSGFRLLKWGTNGKDGKGPRVVKPLRDLDADHLRNILKNCPHIRGGEYERAIRTMLEMPPKGPVK